MAASSVWGCSSEACASCRPPPHQAGARRAGVPHGAGPALCPCRLTWAGGLPLVEGTGAEAGGCRPRRERGALCTSLSWWLGVPGACGATSVRSPVPTGGQGAPPAQPGPMHGWSLRPLCRGPWHVPSAASQPGLPTLAWEGRPRPPPLPWCSLLGPALPSPSTRGRPAWPGGGWPEPRPSLHMGREHRLDGPRPREPPRTPGRAPALWGLGGCRPRHQDDQLPPSGPCWHDKEAGRRPGPLDFLVGGWRSRGVEGRGGVGVPERSRPSTRGGGSTQPPPSQQPPASMGTAFPGGHIGGPGGYAGQPWHVVLVEAGAALGGPRLAAHLASTVVAQLGRAGVTQGPGRCLLGAPALKSGGRPRPRRAPGSRCETGACSPPTGPPGRWTYSQVAPAGPAGDPAPPLGSAAPGPSQGPPSAGGGRAGCRGRGGRRLTRAGTGRGWDRPPQFQASFLPWPAGLVPGLPSPWSWEWVGQARGQLHSAATCRTRDRRPGACLWHVPPRTQAWSGTNVCPTQSRAGRAGGQLLSLDPGQSWPQDRL